MRHLLALPIFLLLAGPVQSADLFAKGDAKAGKALHDKSCISCHKSMLGGDGSAMYSRMERKIKTPQKLQAQISGCNSNAGAGWFPEDELHVGAYLNQQYYKFK
ncbi:MAG: cytochrome c [Sulfuricella sp.]|nr:cytochrome c [Sulfuricella sp.]